MTTTDIARTDDSSIELLPPSRPPAEAARHMLLAHAEMMDTAWDLASKLANTSMVPARFQRKPEDATAAILYGAELGLNPIQSLQRIIVIHGMPTIEARTMVALLKAKGYAFRVRQQSDKLVEVWGWEIGSLKVYGTDPDNVLDYGKRINPDSESTWTIDRARKAGYVPEIDERTGKYKTNKNGNLLGNEKYLTDPQAMLKAKAQAEVCRDMAPEVLMGISYAQEELESERFDDRPVAPRGSAAARAAEPITVDEIFGGGDDDAGDAEQVDVAEDPVADGEAGRGGGNDQSQGAEPSSGAHALPDSGDQPAPEPEPEPVKKAPAKKAAPKKAADTPPAAEKSNMRKALEKRLFALLGDIKPALPDEDRITLYQQILENPAVTSTNDLDDFTIAKVADQLYIWQQNNELDDRVRDLLNAADLAAAAAEDNQPTLDQGE